jgi:glutathione S-transferase
VGGRPDEQIGKEIEFWRSVAERGIPETQVRASVARFRAAFEQLDQDLIDRSFLFGDRLSVIDIAWLVYANRLILCGYPLARLHPRLGHWADDLARRPEFALELALPPPMADRFAARARALQETGMTLQAVCRL